MTNSRTSPRHRLPLLAIAVTLLTITLSPVAHAWQSQYNQLLQKYVSPTGVNYQAWHTNRDDRAALLSITAAIASADLTARSPDEILAFYLNAYNANILAEILADYPTKGPGNGSALGRAKFFRWNKITVAGKKLSFSDLENKIIRKRFNEPRIHFALNCASTSCPPLHSLPFQADTLNQTLTLLTKKYLNHNPHGLQLSNNTLCLSEIFDWYRDDFDNGNLVAYLNQYRTEKIPADTPVKFMPYDWSLNQST
ncbi:MAG: DUF547 domain-containing protein [Verrucomicrobiota bacterium]